MKHFLHELINDPRKKVGGGGEFHELRRSIFLCSRLLVTMNLAQ
jgi:hypothetical protein